MSTLKRLLAPVLATLLVASSVVVPVLDAGTSGTRIAVESEHHPATCVVGHDHTICTQVGSNLALAGAASGSAVPGPASLYLPPTQTDAFSGHESFRGHRPRAPPLARV